MDVDTLDRDQKQRRRLQDALPLEIPPATETKVQPDSIKEGLKNKDDGPPDGTKNSSDPTEVPRSHSYFQVSCLIHTLVPIYFQKFLYLQSNFFFFKFYLPLHANTICLLKMSLQLY